MSLYFYTGIEKTVFHEFTPVIIINSFFINIVLILLL